MSQRRVRPYRHILREGAWYLIAYDTQRADWRLFRLNGIQDAASQPDPFNVEVPDFPAASIHH